MPYCPNCRAEFRPGFKVCNTCKGVALVDQLAPAADSEELQLTEADLPNTEPVGYTQGGSGNEVVVDGVKLDPARVFSLSTAATVREVLSDAGIASAIVKLDVELPDNVPRFEVRVKRETQAQAEATLFELWKETMEEEVLEGAGQVGIDQCPACGAKVPLEVEECPDCGLVVGTGDERAASAEE